MKRAVFDLAYEWHEKPWDLAHRLTPKELLELLAYHRLKAREEEQARQEAEDEARRNQRASEIRRNGLG